MLSVIYCTKEDYPSHIEHIKKTCGIRDVEIIQYINKGEALTKFYNKGLKESKNNIVVFCHDDIIFNTKNWGKKLLNHFTNTDFGILGVAGTTIMPSTGKWWEEPHKMMGQVRHSHEGKSWDSIYCPSFGNVILQSVLVDGLFFAVNKSRIKNNFSKEFKGFHFYEIDFCISNHLAGVKIGVMSNIRLTHKSIGMTNDEWEQNRKQFVNKYTYQLPIELTPPILLENKNIKLKKKPKVSVIIPTKGNIELLTNCVNSLWGNDNYDNMVVYIADTGSSEDEKNQIRELIDSHTQKTDKYRRTILIEYDYYNFAKINNDVVKNHVDDDTELILFCNNDIKLLNNCITQMVNVFNTKKNTGTVGIRLHFGDGTVQHSGVMAFVDQQHNIRITHHGLGSYFNYHQHTKEVFGNTAAFMMIRKNVFQSLGGFNENYMECFEDVDLNIKCLNKRLKNYFLGESVAYHYESQTRKKDPDKLKKEGEDYVNRLLPTIINNKQCYNYFSNITSLQLRHLIEHKFKQQLI
tara:strand:- start:4268 stop:5827 length:1560 start_codon:yes stop_codon:yes gene_type:complete